MTTVVMALVATTGGFAQYTINKNETGSYLHRTAADLYALWLAGDSHWVGVGLGSNRPSSLVPSLLSTLGLTGALLFFVLLVKIARNAEGEYGWLRWSILALVIDCAFAVPDINLPTLWMALALAVHSRPRDDSEQYNNVKAQHIDDHRGPSYVYL